MTVTGFFAGSFDPPTLGHLELLRRARALVDRLVLGVGSNADKGGWLEASVRAELLTACVPDGVEVRVFRGLAVSAARDAGARLLFRGLRSTGDADGEIQMARANRVLDAGLESVFLVSSAETSHISSRLVREVHRSGGDVSLMVPAVVAEHLRRHGPR